MSFPSTTHLISPLGVLAKCCWRGKRGAGARKTSFPRVEVIDTSFVLGDGQTFCKRLKRGCRPSSILKRAVTTGMETTWMRLSPWLSSCPHRWLRVSQSQSFPPCGTTGLLKQHVFDFASDEVVNLVETMCSRQFMWGEIASPSISPSAIEPFFCAFIFSSDASQAHVHP